ncbi:hypothetical protein GGTG_09974 [Gaeumannomyces tritici R3-111a-1]|uniref:Uncharacterized protein n=1 Tax=Gaeumannomyces tritici (strain R3-111a-1) TaxID=644352 RepID=J3P8Z0_GAET3|nr:hypothetical protein GGTG_09974 [Gaeumannomyces tritici R3-111a-1]EJT73125.1 hypothetical protein GGTG_09974 [Gaeumannomyces tritici R3-111a-1]
MRGCHRALWRDGEVKILHYILLDKPWKSRQFDEEAAVLSLHGIWWRVWDEVEREWTTASE